MSDSSCWLPLESDSEIWQSYLECLGVKNDSLQFIELYSLDYDSLKQTSEEYPNIFGCIFLYPDISTKQQEKDENDLKFDVWFLKQINTLGNACGLIALLHCLGNNLNRIDLIPTSLLSNFFSKTSKCKSGIERANVLVNDENIRSCHVKYAQRGSTEAQNDHVEFHYVAYTIVNNSLVELDGCKEKPYIICQNLKDKNKFLIEVGDIVKNKVNEMNGDIRFSLIALATK
ncbi:unnamed protein product [Didymodactylos carnosus]|uniref:Ubiquitin carboxyl-terminal hydrolase n=1 Tax=Didymodactylos carnosus TaxID=1234261 RepID=A0A814TB66_9BILA|nr:unnamed protein product [Didymodactylos carnosus]CAF1265701.1 unnamed protein product [Didymodactylos carnosus]CAF3921089.1 unnamed protein product [Didymodactylos carnosus]CAF4072029.1 unnamed protein product [Didymodactylos carnosus]